MRRLWNILLMGVLLVACAPSQASIETAIANTQAAVPTQAPTATPVPIPTAAPTPSATPVALAELDLAPLLVHAGDLPAGIGTGQITRGVDVTQGNMPEADLAIRMQFSKDDDALGAVTVWLYEHPEVVVQAYRNVVTSLMDSENYEVVADVGDHAGGIPPAVAAALALEASGLGSYTDKLVGEMVFARCHAVVSIALPYSSDTLVPMVAYARSLDQRLSEVACRGDEPIVTPDLVTAGRPQAFEGDGKAETPTFFLEPGKVSVKWTHSANGSYFVTLRQEGSATAIKVAEGSGRSATNIRVDIPEAGNYYFNVSVAGGPWMIEVFP